MQEISWCSVTPSIKPQTKIYFSLTHTEVNLGNTPLSLFKISLHYTETIWSALSHYVEKFMPSEHQALQLATAIEGKSESRNRLEIPKH